MSEEKKEEEKRSYRTIRILTVLIGTLLGLMLIAYAFSGVGPIPPFVDDFPQKRGAMVFGGGFLLIHTWVWIEQRRLQND